MPHENMDQNNMESTAAEAHDKPLTQLDYHTHVFDPLQREEFTVENEPQRTTTTGDTISHSNLAPIHPVLTPGAARVTAEDVEIVDATAVEDAAQLTGNLGNISTQNQMKRTRLDTEAEDMTAADEEETDDNEEDNNSQGFNNHDQNAHVVAEHTPVDHDTHAIQNLPANELHKMPHITDALRSRRRDHTHRSPLSAVPQSTYRVQKSRQSDPLPTDRSSTELVGTPATVSRKPSVEDLLLLLMRRARHQAATESQLVAKQDELKEQYRRVSYELSTCREDLNASEIRERDHLARLQTADSNLVEFQTRFKKFKDWALNVSHDMTTLRGRANKSYTAIEEAKEVLQALRRDTTVLESAQASALEDVGGIRTNVQEVRTKHEQSRQLLISSLSERANQVIVLSNANLQLQHTFLKERCTQKQADRMTDAMTRNTHQQLSRLEAAVSKLLETQHATLKQSPGIEICLKMLIQLTEKQQLVPADLKAFEEHLHAIPEL